MLHSTALWVWRAAVQGGSGSSLRLAPLFRLTQPHRFAQALEERRLERGAGIASRCQAQFVGPGCPVLGRAQFIVDHFNKNGYNTNIWQFQKNVCPNQRRLVAKIFGEKNHFKKLVNVF